MLKKGKPEQKHLSPRLKWRDDSPSGSVSSEGKSSRFKYNAYLSLSLKRLTVLGVLLSQGAEDIWNVGIKLTLFIASGTL